MSAYLGFLALFYGGIKGICGGLLLYGCTPLFIAILGSNSTQYQIAVVLAALPWSTKAIIAIISDTYPIFGWYKRYYLWIYLFVLIGSLVGLAFAETFAAAAASLTAASAGVAFADILLEGHWTESVSFRKSDKRLPSYVWGSTTLGNGIAAVLVGFVSHGNVQHLHYLFGIATIIPIICVIALSKASWAAACLPGDVVNNAPSMTVNLIEPSRRKQLGTYDRVQHRKPSTQEWLLSVGLALVAITLLIAIGSIDSSNDTVFIFSFAMVMMMAIFWGLFRTYDSNTFAILTFYGFLIEALSINVISVVDYWFVATDECILSGPQLSWLTYITLPAIVGSVASIFVSAYYAEHGYKMTVRSSIQLGAVLRITGSAIGELLPTLLSSKPEIIMCLLVGTSVLYMAGSMLQTLTTCSFAARLVNRGTETCQFAIMISLANLGMAVAKLAGLFFINVFSVKAVRNSYTEETTACDYSQYMPLLALTRVIIPVGVICFGYVLAPPARRLTKK